MKTTKRKRKAKTESRYINLLDFRVMVEELERVRTHRERNVCQARITLGEAEKHLRVLQEKYDGALREFLNFWRHRP